MINYLDSSASSGTQAEAVPPSDRLKVGIVAVPSLLPGGLLAACWYRKTLLRLRNAGEVAKNPHFGIPECDPTDEA
jgi:hypothetical protein